jgi:Flp pilus assembly protein CpaB
VALAPLTKGEAVLNTKLASRDARRGMASGIQKGKRAYTIQTPNVATSVAGHILPGNMVDVLLTVAGNGGADGGAVSLTLLQSVEVLAVDQRVEAPTDGKVDTKELRSVTLLVTPEEMVKLDLGQNKGTLHLALRNFGDTAIVPSTRATMQTIGLAPPPPESKAPTKPAAVKPAEPPPPLVIRTVRGTQEGGVLVYPTGR